MTLQPLTCRTPRTHCLDGTCCGSWAPGRALLHILFSHELWGIGRVTTQLIFLVCKNITPSATGCTHCLWEGQIVTHRVLESAKKIRRLPVPAERCIIQDFLLITILLKSVTPPPPTLLPIYPGSVFRIRRPCREFSTHPESSGHIEII